MIAALRVVFARIIGAFRPLPLLAAATWLLVSAFAKLADIGAFSSALAMQGLLALSLIPIVAWSVPFAELTIGIIAIRRLLADPNSRMGWWLCSVVYASLGVYTGFLWLYPPSVPAPCGCAGSAAPVADWADPAIRNFGAAIVLLVAPILRRSSALTPAVTNESVESRVAAT